MVLLGVLFGRLAVRSGDLSLRSPVFKHGLIFVTLFNAAVLYAYLIVPDWMWGYFVYIRLRLFELIYLFLFLYYIPYLAGYFLGVHLFAGKGRYGLACVVLLLSFEVGILVTTWDRYSHVGSLATFADRTAPLITSPDNPIGVAYNIVVGVLALYYFTFCWWLRKNTPDSRH